jgi:hypothetical protein
MYCGDIIQHIIDYEIGMSCLSLKKERFNHNINDNIENFSEKIITQLQENLHNDFNLLSFENSTVYAMIFGKLHTISLEYNKNTSDYDWVVSINDEIKDYTYESSVFVI